MLTQKEFECLFDEYVDDVAAFLTTYTSNSAQLKDWVQEVFIKLWNSRDKIDFTHKGFKGYIFTTARNHALKRIQRENRYNKWLENNLIRLASLYKLSDSITGNTEFIKLHGKALSQIPPRSRKAYLLSRENGLTYKEIADEMDISVKTVEVHIGKALHILRIALKDYTLDDNYKRF